MALPPSALPQASRGSPQGAGEEASVSLVVLGAQSCPWVLRSINEMLCVDHGVDSKESAAPRPWFLGGSL